MDNIRCRLCEIPLEVDLRSADVSHLQNTIRRHIQDHHLRELAHLIKKWSYLIESLCFDCPAIQENGEFFDSGPVQNSLPWIVYQIGLFEWVARHPDAVSGFVTPRIVKTTEPGPTE